MNVLKGTSDALPLVSIVTPSYNQGRFIRETIESVLNQTYKNIEYFVIDGGSTDETCEILKSYGGVFKWISEEDNGQSDAINKGFKMASGEVLAYLNSDDTLEHDAIETVVRVFQEDPGLDLVYGDANYIDERSRFLRLFPPSDWDMDKHKTTAIICQPAAFWTRRTMERFGFFDETLHYAMDYDYWLRIGCGGGRVKHITKVLANSREHGDTKTLTGRDKIFPETFTVSQRHFGKISFSWINQYVHFLFFERSRFKGLFIKLKLDRAVRYLAIAAFFLHDPTGFFSKVFLKLKKPFQMK